MRSAAPDSRATAADGSGTGGPIGVSETAKSSTRLVPAVATVPPFALVIDVSISRKTTSVLLFNAAIAVRSKLKKALGTGTVLFHAFGAAFAGES